MAANSMKNFARNLSTFFGSRRFFYIVMGFFIFEAVWFVFSAIYPMAFDEEFHLGVIKIYAEQWSPFLSAQPEHANAYGAIFRDPSYLYHYLMSFPYRFLAQFTQSETAIVIVLRLMNVALFAWGLVLSKKVMLRAGSSQRLANVALAIFVLIPIVPQLAAHINYDNSLMVLVPVLCLIVFRLVEGFRERRIDSTALLGFIVLCMTMGVVKYATLPFIFAAVLFLLVVLVQSFRGKYTKILPKLYKDFKRIQRPTQLALLGLLLVGSVLFAQRYGVNLARYQAPVPDCGQVLTVDQCSAYGPWIRDHFLSENKPVEFKASPIDYMGSWLSGMWHRLFFAVNGPKADYTNYAQLPVPSLTAIVLAVAGLLAVIVYWRKVFKNNVLIAFLMTLAIIYIVILWADGYESYERTGQPVAINGRYLLPILLPLAVIMGKAFGFALKKWQDAKPLLAALVILLFLYGGGVFTFILRSDNTWYWPNQAVNTINDTARDILKPVIYEGDK